MIAAAPASSAAPGEESPAPAPEDAPLSPEDMDLLSGLEEAGREIEAIRDQEQPLSEMGPLSTHVGRSLGTGAWKTAFETKDFLLGETPYAERSGFRQMVEREDRQLSNENAVNSMASDISQFATGMLGLGKLTGPLKLAHRGKVLMAVGETAKAATVGAVAFDPQEERLSNLIQSYPSLQNPVTAYLASDLGDSDAEARMKSALESIGLDAVLGAAFVGGLKVMRAVRRGDAGAAQEAAEELAAQRGAVDAQPKNASAAPNVEPANAMQGHAAASAGQNTQAAADLKSGDLRSETAQGPQRPPSSVTPDAPNALDTQPGATSTTQQTGATPPNAEKPEATTSEAQGSAASAPSPLPPQPPAPRPITDDDLKRLLSSEWETAGPASPRPFDASQVESPEALQELMARLSKQALSQSGEGAGRTIIPDSVLEQSTRKMAVVFNESPSDLFAMIKASGDNANAVAAQLEAGKAMQETFARDIGQLATRIKYGLEPDMGAAHRELARRLELLTQVVRHVRDIKGAGGRVLRRSRSDFNITEEQLSAWKSVRPEELVDVLYQAGGDVSKVKQTMQPTFWKRVKAGADHLLVNGPLWWYPTHVWNGVSNLMMLGLRPMETLVGSAFVREGGAEVARRSLQEYRYTASSIMDGLQAAGDAFLKGDSILDPHGSYFSPEAKSLAASRAVPLSSPLDAVQNYLTLAHLATGIPTRVLGVQDELFKTIRYRAVVQAKAAEQARALGLRGADAESHIRNVLEDAFDAEGRAVKAEALREAQATTFTQSLKPGTLGLHTQNLIGAIPFGRAILPFIRTPVNAFRHGWKLTPGLNLLQTEYREMLGHADPAIRARAYGQMAIGTSVMALAGFMAAEGRITGSGPRDPEARRFLTAKGWKPYSYVVEHEDGSKSFIPLNRLDPLSMPLGMAADIVDMMQHPEREQEANGALAAVTIALIHNLTDKTFLISLNAAMRAALEPEKNFSKFAGNAVEQALPFSSLLRNVNADPHMKEARGLVDNALDRMPGYSTNVPNKYDAFGEPLLVAKGLWSDQAGDALDAELSRLAMETGVGFAPPSPVRNGTDLRDFTLADGRNAYETLQRYSAQPDPSGKVTLRDRLTQVVNSKAYRLAVDGKDSVKGTRGAMLGAVISAFREAAFKRLLSESPELREALSRRRKEVGSQVRENRRQDALKALGSQ